MFGNFDREKASCSFMKHICAYFDSEYDSRPRALSPKTLSSYGFYKSALVHLTLEVSPLFIVVDLDDVAKWERFKTFYSSILIPLFTVQDVFFLVAGHASFLSMSHCELDDNQLAEVVEHLFTTVRGHPRALLEKFCGCHTYDDLVADASNAGGGWCTFAEILLRYEKRLRRMMNCVLDVGDNSFDLSGDSVTVKGKELYC
ncbi:Hypothetical protein PHPALM_17754 [Phytophthora palmivora]|uniref:Uncharacterized protein n=1 Tax=Phytophthora palmivora TaxID=4796 RepID=A0A2P4XLF0_9STRA|nr:Hypothetical protein PHPALM_17754 [Phytophthora palmivora]